LEQVASLKTDPGFVILCDALQAMVDDISDLVESSVSSGPAIERRLIDYWRTARRFLGIMRSVPEGAIAELNDVMAQLKQQPEFQVLPENAVDKLRGYFRQNNYPMPNLPNVIMNQESTADGKHR